MKSLLVLLSFLVGQAQANDLTGTWIQYNERCSSGEVKKASGEHTVFHLKPEGYLVVSLHSKEFGASLFEGTWTAVHGELETSILKIDGEPAGVSLVDKIAYKLMDSKLEMIGAPETKNEICPKGENRIFEFFKL